MKYTSTNTPLQCFMRQSTWYKGAGKTTVRGVLWHSTGANNPNLKRYVQPDDNAADKAKLLGLLGKNTNGNDWNHISRQAGVHAFIGKLVDGTVTSVQVGEWDKKAWGCGSGKKGSCNNGWVQFEICEDGLTNRDYFDKVYREACELTAYLCKKFNIDPHGTVTLNGVKVPTILCHQDSYKLGLGSNHGDVYNWFNKFGKSMEDVRNDVAALMKGTAVNQTGNHTQSVPTTEGDNEDMTLDRFKELMKEYRDELQDNDCGSWSKDAREWAIAAGLVNGVGAGQDGSPQYAWADTLTREQMAMLLYRFAQMIGKV